MTSFALREMLLKTTVRHHTHLSKWLKVRVMIPNTGDDVGTLDNSCIADGKVKWYSHSGK